MPTLLSKFPWFINVKMKNLYVHICKYWAHSCAEAAAPWTFLEPNTDVSSTSFQRVIFLCFIVVLWRLRISSVFRVVRFHLNYINCLSSSTISRHHLPAVVYSVAVVTWDTVGCDGEPLDRTPHAPGRGQDAGCVSSRTSKWNLRVPVTEQTEARNNTTDFWRFILAGMTLKCCWEETRGLEVHTHLNGWGTFRV